MHTFSSNAIENLQKRYNAAKREATRLYNAYYTNTNTRAISEKLRTANNKVRELGSLLRNAKRANKM
jgi:hypothetical protein